MTTIDDGGKKWGVRCLVACLAMAPASLPAMAQAPSGAAPDSEYECIIDPEQVGKLASPVGGVIALLRVDRGDIVRKGQVLGKLEDGVETAALALARARATNEYPTKSAETRLQFMHRKHGRIEALHIKSISSLAA